MLGACETDFSVSVSDLLDEHLSISSVFLRKGAAEVGGTLYKADAELCDEFLFNALKEQKKPLYEVLSDCQLTWKQRKNINIVLPFRVLGFPKEEESKVAENE